MSVNFCMFSSLHASLRSSNEHLLVVPGVNNKTVTASRAFQNYAPKLWNGLNKDLRNLALTCNFDMLNAVV